MLRIDLAAVSGKYIGETSKNIDAVFDAAERAGQALLIDEADALFGKRTEVNDAHDRYANIDVAYLLQRIEQFNGLVILATNMRDNIDTPFSSAAQHRWRACAFHGRSTLGNLMERLMRSHGLTNSAQAAWRKRAETLRCAGSPICHFKRCTM